MEELTPYEVGYLACLVDEYAKFYIRKYKRKERRHFQWNLGLRLILSGNRKDLIIYVQNLLPFSTKKIHCNKNQKGVVITYKGTSRMVDPAKRFVLDIQGKSLDTLLDIVSNHLIFKKDVCNILKEFRCLINSNEEGLFKALIDSDQIYRDQLLHQFNNKMKELADK